VNQADNIDEIYRQLKSSETIVLDALALLRSHTKQRAG